MKKEKDDPRCIRLDGDVSNIASTLAKERRLSSVLSDLLRKEFGVSFEEDLLESQLNEIQRQKEEIEERKEEIEHQIKLKKRSKWIHSRIEKLETEYGLLKFKCKKEIEGVAKIPIESLEVVKGDLEDHKFMVEVAKARQKMREEIAQRYAERDKAISNELLDLYDERSNLGA